MPSFHVTIPFNPVHLANRKIGILTGQRFGRLRVVSFFNRASHSQLLWLCVCDCKQWTVVRGGNLKTGTSRSCGCHALEISTRRLTQHGEASQWNKSAEYRAYMHAKNRCTNPKAREFLHYGGRGIEFRFTSYEAFLKAVGRRPSSKYTLDRIDVNGHYETGNLRWATQKQQQNNRRNNRIIIVDGRSHTLAEWSDICSIDRSAILMRIDRLGWCAKCAVSIPANQSSCLHKSSLLI